MGSKAAVTQSNRFVLGSIAGVNLARSSTNVAIATTAPKQRLAVQGGHIRLGTTGGAIEFTLATGAHPFITDRRSSRALLNGFAVSAVFVV